MHSRKGKEKEKESMEKEKEKEKEKMEKERESMTGKTKHHKKKTEKETKEKEKEKHRATTVDMQATMHETAQKPHSKAHATRAASGATEGSHANPRRKESMKYQSQTCIQKEARQLALTSVDLISEEEEMYVASINPPSRSRRENAAAQAETYQDTYVCREANDERSEKELNEFLVLWLGNLIEQGHKIVDLSSSQ